MLRIIIEHMVYPVTLDVLQQVSYTPARVHIWRIRRVFFFIHSRMLATSASVGKVRSNYFVPMFYRLPAGITSAFVRIEVVKTNISLIIGVLFISCFSHTINVRTEGPDEWDTAD